MGPEAEKSVPNKLSSLFDALKLDFSTIRTILLTAVVVLALLSVPLLFIMRNFVTFDALDKYIGVTQNVRPKILNTISEELDSGYSRDFFIEYEQSIGKAKTDNTMLFYAKPGQRVTLVAQATPTSGPFSPVSFQIDGCTLDKRWDEPFELLDFDISPTLAKCPPNQPSLHSLRIILPAGLLKNSNIEVECLVIVYHRVREHIQETKSKKHVSDAF